MSRSAGHVTRLLRILHGEKATRATFPFGLYALSDVIIRIPASRQGCRLLSTVVTGEAAPALTSPTASATTVLHTLRAQLADVDVQKYDVAISSMLDCFTLACRVNQQIVTAANVAGAPVSEITALKLQLHSDMLRMYDMIWKIGIGLYGESAFVSLDTPVLSQADGARTASSLHALIMRFLTLHPTSLSPLSPSLSSLPSPTAREAAEEGSISDMSIAVPMDMVSWHRLLALCGLSSADDALLLYHSGTALSGLQPTIATYSLLLRAAMRQDRMDIVYAVLAAVRARGMRISDALAHSLVLQVDRIIASKQHSKAAKAIAESVSGHLIGLQYESIKKIRAKMSVVGEGLLSQASIAAPPGGHWAANPARGSATVRLKLPEILQLRLHVPEAQAATRPGKRRRFGRRVQRAGRATSFHQQEWPYRSGILPYRDASDGRLRGSVYDKFVDTSSDSDDDVGMEDEWVSDAEYEGDDSNVEDEEDSQEEDMETVAVLSVEDEKTIDKLSQEAQRIRTMLMSTEASLFDGSVPPMGTSYKPTRRERRALLKRHPVASHKPKYMSKSVQSKPLDMNNWLRHCLTFEDVRRVVMENFGNKMKGVLCSTLATADLQPLLAGDVPHAEDKLRRRIDHLCRFAILPFTGRASSYPWISISSTMAAFDEAMLRWSTVLTASQAAASAAASAVAVAAATDSSPSSASRVSLPASTLSFTHSPPPSSSVSSPLSHPPLPSPPLLSLHQRFVPSPPLSSPPLSPLSASLLSALLLTAVRQLHTHSVQSPQGVIMC